MPTPPPASPFPAHWTYATSIEVRFLVRAYINDVPLPTGQEKLASFYLGQWIDAGGPTAGTLTTGE